MGKKLSTLQQKILDRLVAGALINVYCGEVWLSDTHETIRVTTLIALSKHGLIKCVEDHVEFGATYAHVDNDYRPILPEDEIPTY